MDGSNPSTQPSMAPFSRALKPRPIAKDWLNLATPQSKLLPAICIPFPKQPATTPRSMIYRFWKWLILAGQRWSVHQQRTTRTSSLLPILQGTLRLLLLSRTPVEQVEWTLIFDANWRLKPTNTPLLTMQPLATNFMLAGLADQSIVMSQKHRQNAFQPPFLLQQ